MEPVNKDKLTSTLETVRTKLLHNWIGDGIQDFQETHLYQHQQQIKKSQDEIAALKQQLQEYKDKTKSHIKMKEERMEQQAHLCEELSKIKVEADAILMEKETEEQKLTQAKKVKAQLEEAVKVKEKSSEQAVQELEKTGSWYKERLALKINRTSDGSIQFIFTCIDLKDPSLPFYFKVKINPDQTYTVSDIVPEIPNLEEFVEKLNRTNNFHSFIIVMRQQFVKLAR